MKKNSNYETHGVDWDLVRDLHNETKTTPAHIGIECNDLDIPKVFIDGQEVHNIQDIEYTWITDTGEFGKKIIRVRYLDDNQHVQEVGTTSTGNEIKYGER
ncbi:protein of unknown function [Oenococcus oeni]|uniref:hypothetical protein n=1 Tax=Oenococcus oeni TaxID=1247 RepID=UPI00107999AA|nr:hypothetical protein [Oenococcus oeni]AVI94095.1 hypothetical protein AX764_04275 [Oenococcus oeni]SYV99709.1 hypothetical protein OENI_20092 [Oenococcus oeni]SYW03885.1 hypothetical protein OENI_90030 [Oenococcus oeni]SYW17663.1 hypothetical protein OENI_10331 [Oenococcus oeni]VDC14612.1 protein of unknown function [Oenococcus oeni]